ncbi:LuxR C-terminal-related transcriptional regulator [Streptomyces pseudovenezuelae]|uniref:helix-turn-helix transcriptional regulator n=1 Tax=Streptomyces pseudovenezuelae TaxID=67350 RepID=UPI002E3143D0|nr:LuxR C-terminal-related transcriptional regulator [Streptomyces pseudovenezuelae]
MSTTSPEETVKRVRTAGLVLPRAPYPGQRWTPRTEAEAHLMREAMRLDQIRRLLLDEIGRLRQEQPTRPRAQVLADTAREAERLKECPLSPTLLNIVTAAAASESARATARRLHLSYETVKSHRHRAMSRLGVHSMEDAVALCTAAGWVTPRETTGGGAS